MEENLAEPNLVKDNLDETFKKMEREQRFNDHLNPVDWSISKPVTKRYPFRPGPVRRVVYGIANIFIKSFSKKQAEQVFETKVEGFENLSGIKNAVVVANHFTVFDCLVYQHILKHKTKILGAEFNNRKGKMGFLMRAGGMLPLNMGEMPLEFSGLTAHEARKRSYEVTKKLNESIAYYLTHGYYLIVYPEQSMWHMYEKPRPFQAGAFHFAVQNNVPIIPMFTTMSPSGGENKKLTVHIGEAIYPKSELNKSENKQFLKAQSFAHFKEVYERVYNKKLKYEGEEK